MMGLYKRKDSPYYWYKFTIEGRPYQDSTKTENAKLAERIMMKRRNEIIEGKHFEVTQDKKNVTLKFYCEEIYIKEYAMIHKKSWKSDDMTAINSFLPFVGERPMGSLTKDDFTPWVKHVIPKVNQATFNHYVTLLRCILNRAVEDGYLHFNPAMKLQRFKKVDNRRKTVLRKDQLETFMLHCDEEMKCFTLRALMTGLRICDLDFTDREVDFENKVVHAFQSKVGKDIDVPMNDSLIYALKKYGPGKPVNFRKRLDKIRTDSGISFQFRDLRRTFSTYLHGLGVDLYTIAVLLGHKSPDALTMIKENLQMTARYVPVSNDLLFNAVKKLDGYCGIDSGMKWTEAVTNSLRSPSTNFPEISMRAVNSLKSIT